MGTLKERASMRMHKQKSMRCILVAVTIVTLILVLVYTERTPAGQTYRHSLSEKHFIHHQQEAMPALVSETAALRFNCTHESNTTLDPRGSIQVHPLISPFLREMVANFCKTEALKHFIHEVNATSLTLRYPRFNLKMPSFISIEDKGIFLRQNKIVMTQTIPDFKLTGIIGLHDINDLEMLKSEECGWQKLISRNYKKGFVPNGKVEKMLVPLHVPDSQTFQHFIDGILPKLMQIFPILHFPEVYILLTSAPRDPFVQDVLNHLKLKALIGSTSTYLRYNLFDRNNSVIIDSCITPPLHPDLWNLGRRTLEVTPHISQEVMSQTYVVLITRETSHNLGRRILNIREISEFLLNRYGPERFKLWKGGTRLESGKIFFGKTAVLIGVHGGGLYNSFLCPVETQVVEITPVDSGKNEVTRRLASNIFWFMTSLVGQPYWRVYAQASDRHHNLYLPMKTLQTVLDLIDEKAPVAS